MRVLLVNMTLDAEHGGGTSEKTAQTARALRRAGDRVSILTTGTVPPQRRAELRGIDIVTLPLLNRRFWLPLPLGRRIRDAVAAADVVLIANHWMLLNVLAARAAKRLGKPYVVVPSGALRPFGRSLLLKRLFNFAAGHHLIRDAAGHIATTVDEIRDFSAYGVAADRVQVIPNAIDVRDDVRPAGRRFPRPFILFAGRLSEEKGPDLLLAAFIAVTARLPHHLVLAGSDHGMLETLRSTVARAGVEARVHFAGFLSGDEKADAFASADAVVVPSRREAMSLVLLEAGAMARPVIMTDRCGVAHLAAEGLIRMTAPDADALANELVDLLASEDRGAMGERLRKYVAANYDWSVVVERYRRILESACNAS